MISLFIPLGQLGFAPKIVQVRIPRSPEPFRVFGQWRREYHVSSLDAQQLENFSIQNHLKPSKGVVNLSVMLISPKKLLWKMIFFFGGTNTSVLWILFQMEIYMPCSLIYAFWGNFKFNHAKSIHRFMEPALSPCRLLSGSMNSSMAPRACGDRPNLWMCGVPRGRANVWEGWQQMLWNIYGKRWTWAITH